MKKILSPLSVCAICLFCCTIAVQAANNLQNFKICNAYVDGQFTDVRADQWFADGVRNAYEIGVMKGNSASTFNPQGNITIAQTITLAARLHSIYVGDGHIFGQTSPWYQTYLEYAMQNDIVSREAYRDYSSNATRLQFASIIYKALPQDAYQPINNISALPDLAINSDDAQNVLALYNAGVLAGSDKNGTFKPSTFIRRCEVAVITTRITNEASRQTFTLANAPTTITVRTAEELLKNIGSDRRIVLSAGRYDLSGVDIHTTCVAKQTDYDGTELGSYTIHDVSNLMIEGNAEILTNDLFAAVLQFENCNNITVSGLTVGHINPMKEYMCEGAVLCFENSNEVTINSCNLYGCGAEGIYAENTQNISVNSSQIYSCTFAGIWLAEKSQAAVSNSVFRDSKLDGGLLRIDSSTISCNNCQVKNITIDEWASLIETWDTDDAPSAISFGKCSFVGNTFNSVTNDDGVKHITFTTCSFSNNSGSWAHPSVTYSGSTPPITSVTPQAIYTKASANIYMGETLQLPVSFAPTNVTDKSVKWSSSNTKVATVDQNGLVKGVGSGSAIITVTASNGLSTGAVITVSKRESILIGGTSIDCNFLGGVSPRICYRNNSGKTIKYLTFYTTPYNAVWDAAPCDITGKTLCKLTIVGPIAPYDPCNLQGGQAAMYFDNGSWHFISGEADPVFGFSMLLTDDTYPNSENQYICNYDEWDCPWYNQTIRYLLISKIEVIYMDGTTETIKAPTAMHSTVWHD